MAAETTVHRITREFASIFSGPTSMTAKLDTAFAIVETGAHRPGVVNLRDRKAAMDAALALFAVPGAAARRDRHVEECRLNSEKRRARKAEKRS